MAQTVYQLTDAATITPDFGLTDAGSAAIRRAVFAVTLGGNRTLAAAVNAQDGQHMILRVTQDATGGRTLTFASGYAFSAPQSRPAPVLSTLPGTTQEMVFGYAAGAAQWWLVKGPDFLVSSQALVWPSWS